ncbi:MAG: fibronectin type III domain-containing protein [Minisyncoccota bacterium]
MKKLLLVGCALLVAALAVYFFPNTASAQTVNLSGYAWSDVPQDPTPGAAWISFRGTAQNGSPYGVTASVTNGNLSGYAWSEYYGWLSFNASDVSGCPSGTCQANINLTTGAVTGWARFTAAPTGTTGIWNGWVHLNPSTGSGVTYDFATQEFSGYAWGENDIGWVRFQGSNYVVVTDAPFVQAPTAPTTLTLSNVTQSSVTLNWNDASDDEDNFSIERRTGIGGTYAVIGTTGPNITTFINNINVNPATLYYYRVRATNTGGNSAYSNEVGTTTRANTATIDVNVEPNIATWTINPGSVAGTGDASRSVSPASAGTAYSITPNAVTGYESPTCTWNTGSGGGTGCSGMTLFGGESASFTVTYIQSFSYNLSNDGDVDVQKAGIPQSGNNVVTATQTAGTGQPVFLSTSGLPSGVTVGFSNQGCVPAAGDPCNFTATFTVDPDVESGTYTITVTGSPLGRTTTFDLEVSDSPDMIVTCSASPSSAEVGQNVVWTVSVDNDPNNNPPYTFEWSGTNIPVAPNIPTTQQYTISYSTTGTKIATATVWDNVLNQATCNTASVSIGANPFPIEF